MSVKKAKKKKKSILRIISKNLVLIANIFAVLLLMMVYLSSVANPEKIWYIALFALGYPYILALNLFFVIFWLFFKPKFSLISFIFIALGFYQIGGYIQIPFGKQAPAPDNAIRVLSFNVQNLVKQNLGNTKNLESLVYKKQIYDFIQTQDAGVVCLQEFLADRKNFRHEPAALAAITANKYFYHESYYKTKKKIDGLIILTRYPIISKGSIRQGKRIIGIYTDLQTDKDTIRVYNIHMASIHLDVEDYIFISNLKENKEKDNITGKAKGVISKLRIAYLKRSGQVRTLIRHIENSPYPVLLCGDINDTPSSYAYHKLNGILNDAFKESGTGIANTYAGHILPSFRIDYILHSPDIQTFGYQRHRVFLSDHFPVTASFIRTRKADLTGEK